MIEEEQIDIITENKLQQQLIDREASEVETLFKDFHSTIT